MPDLSLWFVTADDADGRTNELMVFAETADHAFVLFSDHYYPYRNQTRDDHDAFLWAYWSAKTQKIVPAEKLDQSRIREGGIEWDLTLHAPRDQEVPS